MRTISEMLDRGFGLVSINDMISLTYHDDILKVNFQPLPGGLSKDGWSLPIAARTEDSILEEVSDYFYQLIITYYNHVSADLLPR